VGDSENQIHIGTKVKNYSSQVKNRFELGLLRFNMSQSQPNDPAIARPGGNRDKGTLDVYRK
jgi:hypothetical protein